MANISVISGTLAAAVATGGTITVSYPAGTTRGDFVLGVRHRLQALGKSFACPEAITVVLGALTAVVTYNGATTIPAGSVFRVELDRNTTNQMLTTALGGTDGPDTYVKPGLPTFIFPTPAMFVSLGTPTTAAATAICAAQAIAGAASAVINGTKAASGIATLGAPTGRVVNVVSSNAGDTTQVVTITGLDVYGNTVRQALTLNGTTTVTGTKAFVSVTAVAVSAATVGTLSVGDGVILGLPNYLSNSVFVLKEIQDGAVATAGTIVTGLGITTAASLTNGDVRGTYSPNSAPDGTRAYGLLIALPEPSFYGQPQF